MRKNEGTQLHTKDYENIINWSKVFLKNKSFTTFSGDSKSRALLFQMDKLFESFVGKFMKKVFADTDYNVSTQDTSYYLFDSPQQFKLRPDIVFSKKNGTVVVMDTKWKELVNNPSINYGISQADMYQMYAYSKKYGKGVSNPEVWLLYPLNKEMSKVQIKPYTDDFGVTVHIQFVDVSNIENSLIQIRNQL